MMRRWAYALCMVVGWVVAVSAQTPTVPVAYNRGVGWKQVPTLIPGQVLKVTGTNTAGFADVPVGRQLITVQVSAGTSTVVSAAGCTASVLPFSFCTGVGTGTLLARGPPSASVIRCSCDLATEDIACSNGGKWLVTVAVDESSIADGAFTMTHGHAVGGEVVPCLIQ